MATAEPPPALLVVAFGGPEGPDDVMPFLRNVTRGRDVPPDRLARVAAQYQRFGGVSPLNGINRALVAALRQGLAARGNGDGVEVYWGNRNWAPYLADALGEMAGAGVRRARAFITSAYDSYSSRGQYLEDLARAQAEMGCGAPEVTALPPFFDHPAFVDLWAENLAGALAEAGPGAEVLFSAHAIPVAMAGADTYQAQVGATAAAVAARAGMGEGTWRLVWQSRSGPPLVPWLAPDLVETIARLPRGGPPVVVAPIGFVADHMEVVYDIDVAAAEAAAARGRRLVRAATPGVDPRFVAMILDLYAAG